MIPNNGEVVITDLPVRGCRRYDTIECLSEMKYRGRVEKAYWNYTNTTSLKVYKVDDFRCKFRRNCQTPYIGWWSASGIYRKGKSYFNVLRLGRVTKNATVGLFTCNFEDDKYDPVSVNIVACESKDKILFIFFIENMVFCFAWHCTTSTCSIKRVCVDLHGHALYLLSYTPILTLDLPLCLCLVYNSLILLLLPLQMLILLLLLPLLPLPLPPFPLCPKLPSPLLSLILPLHPFVLLVPPSHILIQLISFLLRAPLPSGNPVLLHL